MMGIKFGKYVDRKISLFQQEKLGSTTIPYTKYVTIDTNKKATPPSSQNNISQDKFTRKDLQKIALNSNFEKAQHLKKGSHFTHLNGNQGEINRSERKFNFGDSTQQISMLSTLRNAQINHGVKTFIIDENDIVITEKELHLKVATVLLIDISQSMILNGEDRITAAKNVAMSLTKWIQQNYKGDSLEIVTFSNVAKRINLNEIPKIKATASHTNISEAIKTALIFLRKQHNTQKQIFMITDGKPSCIRINGIDYTNSFELDTKITNSCFSLAAQSRKQQVTITTFMLSKEEYLKQFILKFSKINNGKVVFCEPKTMETAAFESYRKLKQPPI